VGRVKPRKKVEESRHQKKRVGGRGEKRLRNEKENGTLVNGEGQERPFCPETIPWGRKIGRKRKGRGGSKRK